MTPNQQQEKEKSNLWKNVFFALGVLGSVVIGLQNYYLGIRQSEINHRLDVRDAYFNKGLIDEGKKAQGAYMAERRQIEKILEHCKLEECNLPPELSVMLSAVPLTPIEELLTKK